MLTAALSIFALVACSLAAPKTNDNSIGPVSRTVEHGEPTITRITAASASALTVDVGDGGVTPPPDFNITSLGVNGSGCPAGTVFYVLSEDRRSVTVTFSSFGAQAGPGIPIAENRKNCQLTLGVHVPGGFAFAVATVDYRGYYQLDEKVVAKQDSIYYFQGQLQQASAHSQLTGAVAGADYTYRDSFDLTSTTTSPCGVDSILNINSALQVSNAANTKGSGFITDDSIDASLTQTFNFNWLTC